MGDDGAHECSSADSRDRTSPDDRGLGAGYRHGDRALTLQQMADDVVLTSPLTEAFVFRGRHQVGEVFAAALDLIEEPEVLGVEVLEEAALDGPSGAPQAPVATTNAASSDPPSSRRRTSVEDDDGEDRTELDHDIEHRPDRRIIAEQLARQS